jgi:cytosine/adenosine deaminase-related metal-dependent hydrolase
MITIQNGTLLYGEDLLPAVGNLFIQDNEIVEISDGRARGKVIDAKGCLVAPALINSHIHLGDSVARDVGDGASLDEIVKPPDGIKHRILSETPREDLINSMKVSLQEMIQTGTTTFVDFREGGVEGVEILKEAQEDIPIRAIVLGRQDSFLDKHATKSQLVTDIQKILKISQGVGLSGFGEVEDETAM